MKRFVMASVLWFGNLIAQYHNYIIAFIYSSFLVQFVGEPNVGYVFAGSSAVVVLVLYAAPPIFRSFGTRNVLSVLTMAEIAALLAITIVRDPISVVVLFTLQSVIASAIFIGIDLLIEASTAAGHTGNMRGMLLTVTNVASIFAVWTLGYVVTDGQYAPAFVAAALAMIPFLALTLWLMPSISHPGQESFGDSVVDQFRRSKTLRHVTGAHFLLQICFAWFAIYTPLLLHSPLHEGFTWAEISFLFIFAMLPYLILEYPLGYIADKWLGEKELMIVGFAILSASLLSFSLLHGAPFLWWAAALVLSRIGAAMVEAMTEVHFFKQVDHNDSGVITTFRVLRPAGSIAGPLIASLILTQVSLAPAFAIFGFIMMLGIPLSYGIIDSK